MINRIQRLFFFFYLDAYLEYGHYTRFLTLDREFPKRKFRCWKLASCKYLICFNYKIVYFEMNQNLISDLLIFHTNLNLFNDILILQYILGPATPGPSGKHSHKNAGVFSSYNKTTIKVQVCVAGLSSDASIG